MVDYLYLIFKILLGFCIIIVYLNFLGKTQVSQMNAIDLIGNFILGGIIGGVIYNTQISVPQYLISLVIGILIIMFLNYLVKKISIFRSFAVGKPIRIIDNGKLCIPEITDKANRNRIDILNIVSNLRIMGHDSLADINFLQVEPNGQLSVRSQGDKICSPGAIVYVNGFIDTSYLESIGKDEEWLRDISKKNHIESLDEVFLIEYYSEKLNFIKKDGTIVINQNA